MIGTIRKHSKWLWWIIATLTIISFIGWNIGSRMNGGSGGTSSGNFGTLYGHKITQEAFFEARNEFFLYYWFRAGEWPDKNPNLTEPELEREIYVRLMLAQKAADLGIHVGQNEVVATANEMLRQLGRNGQAVPLDQFLKQVLQPSGLTAQDFEHFVRQYLVTEQMQQAIGLTGVLITPQEVVAAYQRDHQEISAQLAVFSASNYLASIPVSPAAVAQFYTNYLAEYRLPDRMQVSYVAFEVTNFLPAAEQKLSRTNFDEQVDALYLRYGAGAFPDAKTPADAKAQIRKSMIRQQALLDARKQANDFANDVFSQEPARPENLATVARQKGLAARVTAPFAAKFGPEEFTAPEGFIKSAFALSPDEPFAGPIAGPNAVYVIAFNQQLPSEIPPLDQIRDRVTRDYQWVAATALAQRNGTNFAGTLTAMTAGQTFASMCVAAGLQPQILPAFSLSTAQLPELGGGVELNQLKQAAFTTPAGKPSGFETTTTGGFIVYVQSRLPIDQTKMNADLPQYTASLRRERQNEAFGQWLNLEANRELRTTPVFRQQFAPGAGQ